MQKTVRFLGLNIEFWEALTPAACAKQAIMVGKNNLDIKQSPVIG
jgi:hypothetical protein